MKLNRTPNPLDRNARNGENDNWDIIEGETRKINDKVDNFLENLSEDAFNKIIDDIRLNWSHKVDNFTDLPANPKKGDTVAVENDDMIYRYDGSNWVAIIPFTQFSAIAEIDNRLSSQLAETKRQAQFNTSQPINTGKIVVFIDDDGSAKVMTILRDKIFKPTGTVFGVAVNTDTIGNDGKLSWEDLYTLKDEGNTVLSHGHKHLSMINYSDDEVDENLRVAREILNDRGFSGDLFAYPHGHIDVDSELIARKHSIASFGVYADKYNTMPLSQFDLGRYSVTKHTWQECKDYFDNAPDNSLIIFYGHVEDAEFESQTFVDGYKNLINYIKSTGTPIVNPENAIKMKSNLIDAGDRRLKSYFKVGLDGSFLHNDLDNSLYDNNTPITDYPRYISKVYFNFSDASSKGFPGRMSGASIHPNAGTLITIRTYQDFYGQVDYGSFQLYYAYNSDEVFRRRWNAIENKWEKWRLYLAEFEKLPFHYISDTPDEYNSSTSLDQFPRGVSSFFYNLSNNEGFPVKSGMVTTYKFLDPSFNFQEVREAGGYRIYRRYFKGNWSAWRLIAGFHINISRTVPTQNINPGERIHINQSLQSIDKNMALIAKPNRLLEAGITYDCYTFEDGVYHLVITNCTNSTINFKETTFTINRLEG